VLNVIDYLEKDSDANILCVPINSQETYDMHFIKLIIYEHGI